MSKETNISGIGDNNEASKKLRKLKSLCKETEKEKCEIYINRVIEIMCTYTVKV